jgi:hypothetical protein
VVRRHSYALSLKQPWAALVVAGLKTIEVRRWATNIRGRLFIHAARVSDDRVEGWARVNDDIRSLAELTGGLIGAVELTACVRYRTTRSFVADESNHLNVASWFQPPQMFGFCFRDATAMDFVQCRGHVRFFTVDAGERI